MTDIYIPSHQQIVESPATDYNFMISQQRIITHCTGMYWSSIFGILAADNVEL